MDFPTTSLFSARKRRTIAASRAVLPLAAAIVALVLAGSLLPTPAVQARTLTAAPATRDVSVAAALPTLALPAAAAPAAVVEPAIAEAAPAPVASSWNIGISAFGWQAELDACQWVLLDMVASVPLPIVAAHNYCGGGIVLEMEPGDTVTLSGYGYDGTYVVTGYRDAWTGADAASAVSGMDGEVVLQTCYWNDDGTERLVSLRRLY